MANIQKISAVGLASLLAVAAFAQTATTDPVGFVSYNFKQGTQYSGVPMVNPSVFAGKLATVSTSSATVEGTSVNVGAALTAGAAYYLEVVADPNNAGAYIGDRLDVDTTATKTAANASIVIKASPENTLSGNLPPALAGVSFVIRPHVTLAQLTQGAPGLFVTNDKLFIRVNGAAVASLVFNGTQWNQGLNNANSTVVYPGVGFVLLRAGTTVTSGVVVGGVRTNNFVQVIRSGEQVLAEGFPIDSAPHPTVAGEANRLFTNDLGTTFANGDRLFATNPSNGVFTSYTYDSGNNRWMAGLTNGNALKLFNGTKGVYLISTAGNSSYIHVRPFSL